MTQCWILTEGLRGTENQCIALARAAGLDFETKIVKIKQPWKTLAPWIRHFSPDALAPGSSDLSGPFPDVLIASGRKAIAPALWIKKQSGNKTKLIILQSPVIKDKNFDLVIVPQHDRYHAENAMQINGALSLVTHETLEQAATEWHDTLSVLPAPRLAVLIGGTSRTHKITPQIARLLSMQMKKLQEQGFSLMVTASRRTPAKIQEQLRRSLQGDNIHFYDGEGPNPYQAYLAWADAILVTEDSVSMASEAISTGKPVYIIRLEGGSARFKRFHDNLINQGFARYFTGQINDWGYTPPDDLEQAVERIKLL